MMIETVPFIHMESQGTSCTSYLSPRRHTLGVIVFILFLCDQNYALLNPPNIQLPLRYKKTSGIFNPQQLYHQELSHSQSDTSLSIFFRKSSNDPDKIDASRDKSKARKEKGVLDTIRKPFKKKTEIKASYIDTNAIERSRGSTRVPEKGNACRIIESSFKGFFERRSSHMLNLEVHTDPHTNSIFKLLRGKIGRVHVNFDRLAFPRIKISGGGQISLPKDISFALLSIPSSIQRGFNVKRFPSDFELEANNVIFSQDDLKESFWIKKGVELLLTRILKSVMVRIMGGVAVASSSVETIEILETGKIACLGEANFVNGTSIPFEVVTGLKTSTSGQILHFPEIEMHFFPIRDIFPNVKPSILNIPLYKFFPVDLDIGQNANLKVRVDGKRRRLEVSMWAFVTPQKLDRERWKSFRKTSLEESEYKKNAKFYCDVGRWVTKIGRFAE